MFLVAGFFVADAVNCVVDTHKTAVVGGTQTAERLQNAKAPWVTPLPGAESADPGHQGAQGRTVRSTARSASSSVRPKTPRP